MLVMLCSVVVYTTPISHPQTPHFPPYHHQKFQKHKCLAKTQIKSRSAVKENTAANCKQQWFLGHINRPAKTLNPNLTLNVNLVIAILWNKQNKMRQSGYQKSRHSYTRWLMYIKYLFWIKVSIEWIKTRSLSMHSNPPNNPKFQYKRKIVQFFCYHQTKNKSFYYYLAHSNKFTNSNTRRKNWAVLRLLVPLPLPWLQRLKPHNSSTGNSTCEEEANTQTVDADLLPNNNNKISIIIINTTKSTSSTTTRRKINIDNNNNKNRHHQH